MWRFGTLSHFVGMSGDAMLPSWPHSLCLQNIRLFPALGESYYGYGTESGDATTVGQPEKFFFKLAGPQKHTNDVTVQRLAGMQPYNKSEVANTTPLIDFVE